MVLRSILHAGYSGSRTTLLPQLAGWNGMGIRSFASAEKVRCSAVPGKNIDQALRIIEAVHWPGKIWLSISYSDVVTISVCKYIMHHFFTWSTIAQLPCDREHFLKLSHAYPISASMIALLPGPLYEQYVQRASFDSAPI